ncbi:MAG: adenylate/guanylate cyclase domain-containing protein, partial [Chloroflexi bacterium]
MEQQASSQLFRPYVPAALRDALGAGLLRAGQIETYQASILYADLSGFTRLTAAFATLPDGAERLHSILRDYFETMIATITAHGGDVIHIAGDALSAWWPGIVDPTLAIHCGHALHNAIAALNPIPTPSGPYSLELRVGLSAGQVHLLLAGIPNQGIHPVLIGAPIYAASFAEQHAQPGQVQLLLANPVYKPIPPYQSPPDAPVLTWEHFLPPSFARRLRLNTLVAEYRRCVPVFAAFDLPANPLDLQPLVTQAQAIAMRWGGWLNEIEIGNKGAVLVFLFGAPVAHGDDTSRAIGCALELRDRGVIQKAGISVGSLFVGEVGSRLRRVYT